MKLHLNATLRAALIAAITAVGMALPQSYAGETPLTLTIPSNGQIVSGNSSLNWTGSTSAGLSSWKLTFEVDPGTDLPKDIFNLHADTGSAGPGYHLNIGSSSSLTLRNASNTDLATVDISGRTAITLSFEKNVDEDGVSLGTGTFYLSSNGGTAQVAAVTQIGTSGDYNTTFHPGSGSNNGDTRFWTNGGKQKIYNITLTQLDDHVVKIPTSTWQGTVDSHDWSGSVWDTGTYEAGAKAVFGADAHNTVTITTAVQPSAVSISGQAYTFETSAAGSVAAAKMSIAEGASLTVVGTEANAGTVTIASLSGAGNLTVGENGTATVNALNTYTGAMNVTDGGTLNLGSSIILSNLTVADGTVTTQHSGGSGAISDTLTIGLDGTFKVIGQHDAFGYGTGTTKNIVLQGAKDHLATLSLDQTTGNSVTMNAALQLKGYAHITTTKNGFNTHDGAITAEGVDNSIDKFQLRHAATIEVKDGGELTVGEMTYGNDGTHNLTKTGEGTLTFTGTANMQALNLMEGSLVINGGTTTVQGTSTSTLNKTITVNAGSLVLNGTYEIGGNTGEMKITYEGGAVTGNGFQQASGTATVYDVKGGSIDRENATFTVGGSTVTVTEDGIYTAAGEVDYSTFYVNSHEETVSKAYESHEPTAFQLAANTTLQVDQSVAATVSGAGATSIVSIGSEKVLTGTAQNVKIAGAGTYALASGTAALGDVTLGEEWSGNVRISGNTTSGDWNALAKQGSKLELYGVTGYAKQWAAENPSYGSIDVDVVLTDDGDKAAFTATAGSANSTFTTKFTKSVSGTGTLAASAKNASGVAIRENYEFSGDISGWTGEFLFVKGVDTKVTFSEAADRINSKVNRNNGSLAMVVNTTRDAVFSQEVDVTATTLVRDGGCTQFKQAAKLGNLSGAGDIEANDDLTIGGTSGYTGEIQTDSALTVTGAADLSGAKLLASGDVIVAEGASLTLTEGSTIKNVIQNSGTVTLTGLTLGTEYFTETQGSEGAHFGLDDQVTEGANYFTGTSASYVLVVDGGTSTGTGLTWGDKTEQTLTDGKIITKAADIDHTSFHVGGEVSTSDINKVEGVENINVVSGGNLHVDAVSEATIHAESGATVQGEQAQALVKIGENQTVTYADGIKVSDNGSAQFSGNVQVTNNDSETTFSVTNTAMEVQAETLTYGEGATGTLQIVCGVDVDNVINQSGQDLILNTLVASELDNVSALSGDIVLVSTQGDLTINNLVINAEQAVQAVEIVSGQTPEVTVTITDTLVGGSATLLADLTLVGDSTLDVRGGGDNALTLGSTLTVNTTTGFINLDNDTLIALDALQVGQRLALVKAKDGTTLAYGGEYADAWFDGMFNREGSQYTLAGDFQVFADSDAFGLVKLSNTPEPTTGTLSLLALAALAARRRRK